MCQKLCVGLKTLRRVFQGKLVSGEAELRCHAQIKDNRARTQARPARGAPWRASGGQAFLRGASEGTACGPTWSHRPVDQPPGTGMGIRCRRSLTVQHLLISLRFEHHMMMIYTHYTPISINTAGNLLTFYTFFTDFLQEKVRKVRYTYM